MVFQAFSQGHHPTTPQGGAGGDNTHTTPQGGRGETTPHHTTPQGGAGGDNAYHRARHAIHTAAILHGLLRATASRAQTSIAQLHGWLKAQKALISMKIAIRPYLGGGRRTWDLALTIPWGGPSGPGPYIYIYTHTYILSGGCQF